MADQESSIPECRQIAELLTDYLEGTLPEATRELIDWHIDGCGPCVAFVNTFRETLTVTTKLQAAVPAMPPELKQRLVRVLRERRADSLRNE